MSTPVALLLVIFAWSSWIDINGLWVELPLLVNTLPEKWNLGAYIVVITQVANLGPLAFVFALWAAHRYRRRRDATAYGAVSSSGAGAAPLRIEVPTNVIIMVTGAIASVLLAFFWDRTAAVAGSERSVAFLGLVFALALVDCTSSLSFLGFMAAYPKAYMTPYYVGEGLSGLLPSLVAFGQHAGEYECVNATAENVTGGWPGPSGLTPVPVPHAFSVSHFMFFLLALMVASLLAFLVLEFLPALNRYQTSRHELGGGLFTGSRSSEADSDVSNDGAALHGKSKDVNGKTLGVSFEDSKGAPEQGAPKESVSEQKLTRWTFAACMAIAVIINALGNSILSSIQTYSLLPYGSVPYSLGVKLAAAANPVACFLAFFVVTQSVRWLAVQCGVVLALSAWIIGFAALSPAPPLVGSAAGGPVMVRMGGSGSGWAGMRGV